MESACLNETNIVRCCFESSPLAKTRYSDAGETNPKDYLCCVLLSLLRKFPDIPKYSPWFIKRCNTLFYYIYIYI